MKTLITSFLFLIMSFFNIAQSTLDSGLVAYFPFNGNTIDESGNGHDGTINGNAALVPDRFNIPDRAFTFPDQSSNISLANSTNLNLESGFTFNSWVKYKNTYSVIIGKHICGYVNGLVLGIDYDGQFQLWLGDAGWQTVRTSETLIEDKWYMLTATYDRSSETAKIYLDGQLENSANISYTNFSPYPISIGEVFQNNCQPANMPGAIDEVKIYNRALSDAEILAEYNSSNTDLVAYYPFNGNANDESGNGNNGILMNGALFENDRDNISNQAIRFNKSLSQYVDVQNSPSLQIDSAISFSFWTKRNILDNGQDQVLNKGGDWPLGTCNYGLVFSEWTLCFIYNGGYYIVASPGVPLDYNWHHYAVTALEGTTEIQFYVDGVEQTALFGGGDPVINLYSASSSNLHIGGVNYYSNNSTDDLKIYNRILSEQEIKLLYSDLVAYFPFNGNANDLSVFANHGTVYDALLTKDRYANPDSAYYFNGSTSRIQGPQNSAYSFGYGDFTMSAWVNISLIGTARIVSAGYDANDNIWGLGFGTHSVWGTGTRINYFVYSDNNFRDFSSDEVLNYSPGEWIFVAASKTGNQINFYANGLPIGAQTINYPSNANSFMSIGCRQYSSGVFNEFFNGKIDELKIFNKSFSDEQIWDMYKATTTAPTLLYPGNDSTLINPYPTIILDWDSTVTANQYRLLIASDSLFNTIVKDTLTNTSSFDLYYEVFIYSDNLYWKVRTINDGGVGPWSEVNHFNFIYTDVKTEDQLPTEFALMQNYPNPFNPSTKISWQSPVSSWQTLKVFDVLGNEVATLVNEYKPAGSYEVEFSTLGGSASGRNVTHESLRASGVYFYQLKAGEFIQTKKMIMLK